MRWLVRSLALCGLLLGVGVGGSASAVTIFGNAAQPEAFDHGIVDPTNYELGTVFSSSVAGDVTALRFYLGPVEGASPGTIVGRLWDGLGNLLASETYTGLAVGWNEVILTTAVSIGANTTYVVSANTNAGSTGTSSYAAAVNGGLGFGYFGGGGVTSGPLTATAGVFTTPGAFPTTSFPNVDGGNSYFRDVQFTAVPEPSTALFVGLGLVGVSLSAGRRRQVAAAPARR